MTGQMVKLPEDEDTPEKVRLFCVQRAARKRQSERLGAISLSSAADEARQKGGGGKQSPKRKS
jgi:hypothetical protein